MTRPSTPLETCREWVDTDRCNEDAAFILWGKFFAPEALGPRCYDHAAKHIGWQHMYQIDQWAVFDLRHLALAASGPHD